MYLPGIDDPPDDLGDQSRHCILVTTKLAHSLTRWMNTAAELLEAHADPMFDEAAQKEIALAAYVLRHEATCLSIMALDEDARPPITGHRIWRYGQGW